MVLLIEMLEVDGYLLGILVNLGYISGVFKYVFDVCYYFCLDIICGCLFGVYIYGNEGIEGVE